MPIRTNWTHWKTQNSQQKNTTKKNNRILAWNSYCTCSSKYKIHFLLCFSTFSPKGNLEQEMFYTGWCAFVPGLYSKTEKVILSYSGSKFFLSHSHWFWVEHSCCWRCKHGGHWHWDCNIMKAITDHNTFGKWFNPDTCKNRHQKNMKTRHEIFISFILKPWKTLWKKSTVGTAHSRQDLRSQGSQHNTK